MKEEGPLIESLTRRIAETPAEYLLAPRIGAEGDVHVPAIVYDTLRRRGIAIPLPELAVFAGRDPKSDRVRLSITLLACWLLADDGLELVPTDLAVHGTAARLLQDPDRREELARLTLARLGLRPAGETIAQAQDRLTTLSSAERERVLKASRQAEERARAIRAALVRKAAEESADKWTRE
jgi:hypothetical protein